MDSQDKNICQNNNSKEHHAAQSKNNTNKDDKKSSPNHTDNINKKTISSYKEDIKIEKKSNNDIKTKKQIIENPVKEKKEQEDELKERKNKQPNIDKKKIDDIINSLLNFMKNLKEKQDLFNNRKAIKDKNNLFLKKTQDILRQNEKKNSVLSEAIQTDYINYNDNQLINSNIIIQEQIMINNIEHM